MSAITVILIIIIALLAGMEGILEAAISTPQIARAAMVILKKEFTWGNFMLAAFKLFIFLLSFHTEITVVLWLFICTFSVNILFGGFGKI